MHPSRMHYRAVISGAADFIDYTVPDCFACMSKRDRQNEFNR